MQQLYRQQWDIKEFDRVHLPRIIAEEVYPLGYDEDVRVLDMPIHIPGQGFALTPEIMPFMPIILAALSNEMCYSPTIDNMYVYVTIDQKYVLAGSTARRAGAHSDGYLISDDSQIDVVTDNAHIVAAEKSVGCHTYVWHDAIPTEFFTVPFPLINTSDSDSLRTFDEIANSCASDQIMTFDNYAVLMLTPYVVHRCAIVPRNRHRSFVKISVSDKQFRRAGNTHNPMLKYDWTMDKRSPSERNTPWSV